MAPLWGSTSPTRPALLSLKRQKWIHAGLRPPKTSPRRPGSWGLLGSFWADLEVAKTSQRQLAKKRSTSRPLNVESSSSLGGVWKAKIHQKCHPRQVKFHDDFQERKQRSSRASWSRLGPILGHFGSHLGVARGPGTSVNVMFREFLFFYKAKLPKRI